MSPISPPLAIDLGRSWDRFVDGAQAFGNHFTEIGWGALAIAFALYLGMLLARSRAWQNVLRAAYPERTVRFNRIAGAYIAGAGLNSFIPAHVGDVVKIFLAKRSIRDSTYPTITSSFFVQTVFDTSAGILVLLYAITQGLLPKPPELPDLPAFDVAFWAQHPRFLMFFLTAAGIGLVVAYMLTARRAEKFWDRIRQGAVVLTDIPRYLREVWAWQGIGWLFRFASFWFFLEAFHIGGSFESVMLVMSVQSVSTVLPLTPGGAGAQQALLVATLAGAEATRGEVLAFSVGQQVATAAWTALLGFIALVFVFRTTDIRGLIRSADKDTGRDKGEKKKEEKAPT